MSKAFTKESDDTPDFVLPPRESQLPAGVSNYVTAAGASRLRAERERLRTLERPTALQRAREPGARPTVLEVDARLASLDESLARAEVIDPLAQDRTRVLFGATVTVRDEHNRIARYRIVGLDETDAARCWISWLTPLAKALLGHAAGDTVVLRLPRGDEELEIVAIEYEP